MVLKVGCDVQHLELEMEQYGTSLISVSAVITTGCVLQLLHCVDVYLERVSATCGPLFTCDEAVICTDMFLNFEVVTFSPNSIN